MLLPNTYLAQTVLEQSLQKAAPTINQGEKHHPDLGTPALCSQNIFRLPTANQRTLSHLLKTDYIIF